MTAWVTKAFPAFRERFRESLSVCVYVPYVIGAWEHSQVVLTDSRSVPRLDAPRATPYSPRNVVRFKAPRQAFETLLDDRRVAAEQQPQSTGVGSRQAAAERPRFQLTAVQVGHSVCDSTARFAGTPKKPRRPCAHCPIGIQPDRCPDGGAR